ncbi:hypothetical protein LWI29_005161 [Acer saccharum]|uniref:UDP-N-acetylglucosamine 1-carboxyvinyltransferase n=1 Tax=Acer saccharum TaxID=4024 RepID=A0AA39VUH7_ACESA|nr:hypothetical protein LWI29_005161 [Acer saccharum]
MLKLYTVSVSLPLPQTHKIKTPKPHTLTITGPTTLSGHLPISGSKNSSLPLLAATLLCSNSSLLHSVPTNLTDTNAMLSILRSLGAKVEVDIGNKSWSMLIV